MRVTWTRLSMIPAAMASRVSSAVICQAIDNLNDATQELGKALYEEVAKKQAASAGQQQQAAVQEAEVKRKGGDGVIGHHFRKVCERRVR